MNQADFTPKPKKQHDVPSPFTTDHYANRAVWDILPLLQAEILYSDIKWSISHGSHWTLFQFLSSLAFALIFQYIKHMNLLEHVHKRDTKIVRDLDHLSCMKRLRMLALLNLEKRKLKGYFVAAFQYLKGIYKKDGNRQFSRAHCNRTRGNGFKLKKRYIYLR